MPRPILDESRIHPAIRERVETHQQAIVKEVQAAGKSRIAAAEFARGRRLKIGDCFE